MATNKALSEYGLEYGHAHLSVAAFTEVSSCDRDCMIGKAQIIYHLIRYVKSLPTSSLE